jgi:hypothetical protein
MKKLTLSVAALTIAMMSYGQTQCVETTKQNVQCKNVTKQDNLCYLHNPNYVKSSDSATVVCTGTTKAGNNCKRKTKNASGLCYNHKND